MLLCKVLSRLCLATHGKRPKTALHTGIRLHGRVWGRDRRRILQISTTPLDHLGSYTETLADMEKRRAISESGRLI